MGHLAGKLRISALFVIVAALAMVFMGQSSLKSLIIDASGDSYVVTDIADDADPQGFRDTNYGSLEFLKTWYAWGVIGNERLLSIDLVKFDLAELEDLDIESVSLQLFARQTDLTEAARLVDVHLVQDPWDENTVTFNTRPAWDQAPIATAAIYGAGGWYSWNVTGTVAAGARRGQVSYAVALRSADEQNEEQVLFVSTEGLERAPRLLVTYNESPESGIAAIVWWWWIVAGAGAVAVVFVAFFLGRRRGGQMESASDIPSEPEEQVLATPPDQVLEAPSDQHQDPPVGEE